ncbi:MAG: polyprenyl synthetase family protein, partial [Spirochaetales bacterium]
MNRYFTGKREKITAYLRGFLDNVQKNFSAIHPLGADLIDRLFRFTAEGKMLRGALACLGYDLFRNSADDSMISLGAAIELFQSALLIHDDIMDRDVSRRGKPSLFYHYQQKALNENLSDAFHAGESLAICAGDAAFFLAYEILGKNPF